MLHHHKLVQQKLPLHHFLPYFYGMKQFSNYEFFQSMYNRNSKTCILHQLFLESKWSKSLVVIVRLQIYFGSNDGNMASINCTKYKRDSIQTLKINTNLLLFQTMSILVLPRASHVLLQHDNISNYNTCYTIQDSEWLSTIH